MRSSASRARLRLFSLLLLYGVAEGCASISSNDAALSEAPNLGDSGVIVIIGDSGASADAGGRPLGNVLNPLCGAVGRCLGSDPDDRHACALFAPGGSGSGKDASHGDAAVVPGRPDASPDGGARFDSGALPDAGAPDSSVDGGSADAREADGSAADASVAPPPGMQALDAEAPARRADGSEPPPYVATPEPDAGALFACQVRPVDKGAPIYECVPAGVGDVGAPCVASLDCRAGLACVGSAGAGQCRQYCCHSIPSPCKALPRADDGVSPMFCSEQPLLDGRGDSVLNVPVCVPADGCRLDEAYSCKGAACTCPRETTCTVVLPDGTTSCAKPGTGRGGDACPCESGYFCSAAGTCTKYCKPGVTDALCAPGRCQGAAGLPPEFGLCVGADPGVR